MDNYWDVTCLPGTWKKSSVVRPSFSTSFQNSTVWFACSFATSVTALAASCCALKTLIFAVLLIVWS